MGVIDENYIRELLNIIDKKKLTTINKYNEILASVKECNVNCKDICLEFCKGYKHEKELANNWDMIDTNLKSIFGLSFLKKISLTQNNGSDAIKIFKKYEVGVKNNYILSENEIIIKENYLYPINDEQDGYEIMRENVNKFYNGTVRSLVIKSPYDTGKTTLLKSVCKRYKKVLFISYRITLSNNIMGTLGFKKYTDSMIGEKIVCQLDSIDKLMSNFEIIILDEIESILMHLSASTLTRKDTVKIKFIELCKRGKIIALDGDLSNRGLSYMNMIDNSYELIINIIKKNPKHLIFGKNRKIFDYNMECDLKAGRNICIVSMSEADAIHYADKFKDYKVKLYTSKTDDIEKAKLSNVNEEWVNCNVLIYTPCIESGVDFNLPHFYNEYVIISSGSTSQRGLSQMMHRVRQFESNRVMVLSESIPLNDINENYFKWKESDISIYYDNNAADRWTIMNNIALYNELEDLNKQPNIFLPVLIEMILDKGYTYEIVHDDNEDSKYSKIDKNTVKKLIPDLPLINEEVFKELQKKMENHVATTEDKLLVSKYCHFKKFNLDFCKEEDVKKYYGKLFIVNNFRGLHDHPVYSTDRLTRYCRASQELINILACRTDINLKEITFENKIIMKRPDKETQELIVNNFNAFMKIDFNKADLVMAKKIDKRDTYRSVFEFIRSKLSVIGFEMYAKESSSKRTSEYVLEVDLNVWRGRAIYLEKIDDIMKNVKFIEVNPLE